MNAYTNELMDHYRYPRNRGRLESSDFQSAEHNPSCGDSVTLFGCVRDGRLTAVAFEGAGCVISQAAASMLTVACKDKPLDEIKAFDAATMLALIAMELGPVRVKCALLALEGLKSGIRHFEDQQK